MHDEPTRGYTLLRILLLIASLAAIGNLMWWAAEGITAPLFWDDAEVLTAAQDLVTHPLEPSKWRSVALACHPPFAFAVQALILHTYPHRFALVAHAWQVTMLVVLCAIATSAYWAAEGAAAALLTLGLFASWPFVPAVAREILQDLPTAVFGLLALTLWHQGYRRASVGSYGLGCALKLTVVGFLPALLWLSSRDRDDNFRLPRLLMGMFSCIPIFFILFQLLLGHESINISYFREQPSLWSALKILVVHGLRHALEISIYDGRWALSLAAVTALSSRRRKLLHSDSLLEAMGITAFSLYAVVTLCGGSASLQRYLVPIAMPLSFVLATVILRSRSSLAVFCATLGIAQGILISNDLAPWLSRYEHRIAQRLPGLGRSIDSRPAWMKQFVDTQAQAIGFIACSGNTGVIGAAWPASFAMTEPQFGYVEAALPAREWNPGEPTTGLQTLWVDAWKGNVPAIDHSWRKEFGERYRVLLFGVRSEGG